MRQCKYSVSLASTEDIDLGDEWIVATMERWVMVAGTVTTQSADVIW